MSERRITFADSLIRSLRMALIDWPSLARNALWIVGLSVVLAAWSYTSWLAARREVRLRQAIGWPAFEAVTSAGLALFSASLAWGATRSWERLLWIVLAALFLGEVLLGWRTAAGHGWLGDKDIAKSQDTSR
jgi:hypothetical protein